MRREWKKKGWEGKRKSKDEKKIEKGRMRRKEKKEGSVEREKERMRRK